jgi:uncharacterized protein (TIGR03067 family)
MKFLRASLALLCAATLTTSGSLTGAETAENTTEEQRIQDRLSGIWDLQRGVNRGRQLSDAETDGTTVVIEDFSIVTYDKEENELYRATYILDASEQPVRITMTTSSENRPKQKALGILKFDPQHGDRWTLCYALPGHRRPTEFESRKGGHRMLFEMKKKTAEPGQQ